MKPTTFYIVRHGETDWNIVQRIQGHTDNDINKTGEMQAAKAAHDLDDVHIDMVYSSDLLRARRTAEIIAAEKKLTVHTTQALRERNYGKFEGKLFAEVDEFYRLLLRAANAKESEKLWKEHRVESNDIMIARIITFIREVAIANPGKTALLVSHGGAMRQILIHLGFYDADQARKIRIANTGRIHLESDGVEFIVKNVEGVTVL